MKDVGGDVTRLLVRWSGGDQSAADELTPVVYNELRRLALGHLRQEDSNPSLQATALVHEAYLRMVDKLMRNILVDAARHQNADKLKIWISKPRSSSIWSTASTARSTA